jgi:hypothetical protein
MRNFAIVSGFNPRPVRYSRALGGLQLFLKIGSRLLVQLQQPSSQPALRSFLGGVELPLRQRDSALLRDDPYRLRKANLFDLLDKLEDIPRYTAAKTVVELPRHVHGK